MYSETLPRADTSLEIIRHTEKGKEGSENTYFLTEVLWSFVPKWTTRTACEFGAVRV